jgi:DNA-binding CsgD family transcriptional regulator
MERMTMETQPTEPLTWILSATAAALYRSLLSDTTVDGRGDAAGELLATGFALVDPVTNVLVALPPEVPIVRALAARTHQWLSDRPDVESVQRDLIELARHDRRSVQLGSPTHLVQEFTTREQRGVAITAALTSARSELSSMQPMISAPEGSSDPEQVTFVPEDVLRRGVAIRFLYERSVLDDADFLRAALEEVALGVQARVTGTLPADAIVIDRSALLVLKCQGDAALYTTAKPLVTTFLTTFESMWATAVPLGVTNLVGGDHGLSEMHKMVLSNVLAGRPNDAIGRALKIDPRTVRRRIYELCDALGVGSRAELMSTGLAQLRD